MKPAFIKELDHLSAQDVETSRSLSSVRIHIEHVIGLLKNRFAILRGIIPLRVVKSLKDEAENADVASADKIVGVCHVDKLRQWRSLSRMNLLVDNIKLEAVVFGFSLFIWFQFVDLVSVY